MSAEGINQRNERGRAASCTAGTADMRLPDAPLAKWNPLLLVAPKGSARFDPFRPKQIMSHVLSVWTVRFAAAFYIGKPMEWSAKQSQTGQPFGSWADDLANAFVQLEPRKIGEHPFQGTISRTNTSPIRISRVIATKHRVLRRRSHIAHSTDDLCFINLQLEGVGRYTQRGHEQICGPGDLAVADTTEPFEIANGRDFQLFCFAVPSHLLPRHFSERPRLTLSLTEAGRALSRTLSGYAELCLNSQAPLPLAALSGGHIVDLISHASDVLAGGPFERLNAPVLLSMMLDHIDRHSDDASLSAATLARQFHCSERYV